MSNEPVIVWPTLGLLIGAVLSAFMVQFMPDVGSDMINSIVELVVFLVPVLGGLWYARRKVTPVANPRAADGRRLVPTDDEE